jgi:hypothetical protein
MAAKITKINASFALAQPLAITFFGYKIVGDCVIANLSTVANLASEAKRMINHLIPNVL